MRASVRYGAKYVRI